MTSWTCWNFLFYTSAFQSMGCEPSLGSKIGLVPCKVSVPTALQQTQFPLQSPCSWVQNGTFTKVHFWFLSKVFEPSFLVFWFVYLPSHCPELGHHKITSCNLQHAWTNSALCVSPVPLGQARKCLTFTIALDQHSRHASAQCKDCTNFKLA